MYSFFAGLSFFIFSLGEMVGNDSDHTTMIPVLGSNFLSMCSAGILLVAKWMYDPLDPQDLPRTLARHGIDGHSAGHYEGFTDQEHRVDVELGSLDHRHHGTTKVLPCRVLSAALPQ